MNGSIIGARWRQCAPHLVHPNGHLHGTGGAPCSAALSMYGHVLGLAPFHTQNCPFMCGDLDLM